MSFYRIYRPQVIEEIDNVAVRQQLLSLLAKEKKQLPHAFLFTGPRGAGKTTAARIIAKIFNCKKTPPCGTCDQCKSIEMGRNLDVLEIDAASNRGIDEIRALRDAINLTPSGGAYKIYIIDEVHMLTTEAGNALLKTLEEPPSHAVFVLATTDPQKVPATIKSRCVPIVFHKASAAELSAALERIVSIEHIDIEKDALDVITQSVDGAFRDAVKMLELVSFHKGKINAHVIRDLISLSDESKIEEFLRLVTEKDLANALKIITQLVADGNDVKLFLTECLSRLHLALLQGTPYAKDLIRVFTEAYGLMNISPIAELPLEVAVVEYCGVSSPIVPQIPQPSQTPQLGLLTLEKLTEHWLDFIAALKPYNNSVAGVLRSARPKSVDRGIVTIEAFYPFHKDKLSESKTRDMLVSVFKTLFGERVTVEIVLGKK